ncbi:MULTISPECIES: TadE/TadG family type IV pilus assembly protein [unclassified Streptomyces]|uniref:TadE/TadG family type IV pilus assembly protein n=1 Tax=unclassified Streptomyces TaxID=2593676 RepID=UPI002552E68F|nr:MULTISPECIES: TadE/TadG family type IV pilus assembly protein [unclassified Streptomyces]WRZ66982.1 pilus assembly protein [Streptomyces sp. NBC_01257]
MVTNVLRRQPVVGRVPAGRTTRQRGQAAVEYVGVLTLLLVVALAVVQLGIGVYAAQQAGTAARAGARVGSDKYQYPRAVSVAHDSLSDWLDDRAKVTPSRSWGEVTVKVKVTIPSLLPMFKFGSVTKQATMPTD